MEKARAAGDLDNRRSERTPRKIFTCGSQDHLIVKFTKPLKENEKRRKQARFNEKVNHPYENVKNNSNQKIYASMVQMSGIDKCSSGNLVTVHN